jgi:hypothetical protein
MRIDEIDVHDRLVFHRFFGLFGDTLASGGVGLKAGTDLIERS